MAACFLNLGPAGRSFELHDQVMRSLVRIKTLTGTSNVYFAKIWCKAHRYGRARMDYGHFRPGRARYANRFAFENWVDVYNGDLGIALTDTFGSELSRIWTSSCLKSMTASGTTVETLIPLLTG